MITLLTPRVWADISNAAASSKSPARVAVAYFGQKGDSLLPLPAGSALVTDASIASLTAGSTCPAALERLRKKGTDIFSAQDLHAKVYAFDKVAFIGSANASYRSEMTLIEAVLRVDSVATILSVRHFVESLCLTKLSAADLAELSHYYKPPKFPTANPQQAKYSTLLMVLTYEQGGSRVTQVQPPKAVWEHYFQIKVGLEKLPMLSLINESVHPLVPVKRHVIKHHHNYTIELPGTELPRPAILQMRRIGHNKYSYRVHRPADSTFGKVNKSVQTLPNPLWEPGRRWVLV
jgi:hypothetical protein